LRLTQIAKRIEYIPVQHTSPENHDSVNGALIFERTRKTRWLLPWHRQGGQATAGRSMQSSCRIGRGDVVNSHVSKHRGISIIQFWLLQFAKAQSECVKLHA